MAFHFDPRIHCQRLRSKEMYAQEPRDPGREAEMSELYGSCDTAAFWCQVTQTARGPDGGRAVGELCRSGRKCFVGIEDLK